MHLFLSPFSFFPSSSFFLFLLCRLIIPKKITLIVYMYPIISNTAAIIRCSEVFFTEEPKKDSAKKDVNAYSVFKGKIFPEWEDSANRGGKEWCSTAVYIENVDVLWEDLVIGALGQIFEENNEICGCRIVQKAKSKKNPQITCRLQLWLRSCSEEVADAIKERMVAVLMEAERERGELVDDNSSSSSSSSSSNSSDLDKSGANSSGDGGGKGGGGSSGSTKSSSIPDFEMNLRS